MKKTTLVILTAGALLGIVVAPVLAASGDFLAKATEYYQKECQRRRNISRSIAMICYLFDKTGELDRAVNDLQNIVDGHVADINSLKDKKSILSVAAKRGANFRTSSTTPVPTGDKVNINCPVTCNLWVNYHVDTRNSQLSANPAGYYNFYSIFIDGVDQAVFNQASFPVPNVAIPLALNGLFPVSVGDHTIEIYAYTNGGELQSFESGLQVMGIEQ